VFSAVLCNQGGFAYVYAGVAPELASTRSKVLEILPRIARLFLKKVNGRCMSDKGPETIIEVGAAIVNSHPEGEETILRTRTEPQSLPAVPAADPEFVEM